MRRHSTIEPTPVDRRCRALLRHTSERCTYAALRYFMPVCGVHLRAIEQRPDRHPPDLVKAVKRARGLRRLVDIHKRMPHVFGGNLRTPRDHEILIEHIGAAWERASLIEQTAGPEVDDYALFVNRTTTVGAAIRRALEQIDRGRREGAGGLRLVRGGGR